MINIGIHFRFLKYPNHHPKTNTKVSGGGHKSVYKNGWKNSLKKVFFLKNCIATIYNVINAL